MKRIIIEEPIPVYDEKGNIEYLRDDEYVYIPRKSKPAEWSDEDTIDEFTRNIRNLITDKLTVHTKGLDGSEVSSTVFIDDKTAKDIASGILFYVGKEALKNPNREIPEWSEEDEKMLNEICANLYALPETREKWQRFLKSLRPCKNK